MLDWCAWHPTTPAPAAEPRPLTAVTRLAAEPRPAGARALVGEPSGAYRIRVGDHRVVYRVEDDRVVLTIIRVAHRREVYRKG